jgi:hypothetical protein
MCEPFFTQTRRFQEYHGDLPDAFSEMELIDTVVLPAELSLKEFHSFALNHDLDWTSGECLSPRIFTIPILTITSTPPKSEIGSEDMNTISPYPFRAA